MEHVMSLALSKESFHCDRLRELPLRPLLYVAGAAGTAAGLYYLIKKHGEGERTEEHEHIALTQNPVQTVLDDVDQMNPSLGSDVDGVRISSVPEDLLAEAEKRYEQAMKNNTELEKKNSYLMSKVNGLREELSMNWMTSKRLMLERELEKDLLAEADRKHKKALEFNAQLEKEKAEVMLQVEELSESVHVMNKELSESKIRNHELMRDLKKEKKQHNKLKSESDRMKKQLDEFLKECGELKDHLKSKTLKSEEQKKAFHQEIGALKASLAEAERERQVLLSTKKELLMEKTDLTDKVSLLRDSLVEMEEELCESKSSRDELLRERELEKDLLDEADRKHKKAMEFNAQLEKEKAEVMLQVEELSESVHVMNKELSESKIRNHELMRDLKKEKEQHNKLKSESDRMNKQLDKFLKGCREMKDHVKSLILKSEEQKKAFHQEIGALKASLAAAERERQVLLSTKKELLMEKTDLTDKVSLLRDSLVELEEELCESKSSRDELSREPL